MKNNENFLDNQVSQQSIDYFTNLYNENPDEFEIEVMRWINLAGNKLMTKQTYLIEYTHMLNVFMNMITKIQTNHIKKQNSFYYH